VATLATTQLIDCQNSTIAVLSASLQSLCFQSTGEGGPAISQMDKQDLFGRCQVYIQDTFRKMEAKFNEELLEQKSEYRVHLLTFQEAYLLQAEKQEKLAAALEELQVMRATASLGEQQVSAEVVMADCKT